jgi:hypothetical protein
MMELAMRWARSGSVAASASAMSVRHSNSITATCANDRGNGVGALACILSGYSTTEAPQQDIPRHQCRYMGCGPDWRRTKRRSPLRGADRARRWNLLPMAGSARSKSRNAEAG